MLFFSGQVTVVCAVVQAVTMSSAAVPKPSPVLSALDNLSLSSLLSGDLEEEDGSGGGADGDLEVNPYDGLPYSSRYYSLLEERKQLEVWSVRFGLLEQMETHSMMVLSADGGAGKSTQVQKPHQHSFILML